LIRTVPDPEDEETYPPSSLETTLNSAVETLESTADILQDLMDGSLFRSAAEDEGSIGTALADLFFGEEADGAPVKALEPTSTETGSSPKGTPQPFPPLTPPADGSSFLSLSGAGQIGSGGGAGAAGAPLVLLCVLASGLIVLRRDGRLSRAFCELPKPSSALLMPLERPG
jgi:hypothetical protein